MPHDEFRERQSAYLDTATRDLAPGDPLSVIAHAERARRESDFTFAAGSITPDELAPLFGAIDGFADTTDFDVLYLLNLWYGYGDDLPLATRDAIAHRLLAFKYWYTEPTPAGVVDDKWYWSENHRIIFHTDEYLAGHAFPDAVFTNDGRTGAEHAADADRRIRTWLDEKVRFGFTEWHSDVYYQKDVTPLLTLAEFAPDADLARRAAMVLDLVLLDIALHLHRGNSGATHGRSYMKDKSTAVDQEVFGLAKLIFDDTREPYPTRPDAGAVLFARAARYRVPPAIRSIAVHDEPMVDRERMNVPLDPDAPVVEHPDPPYGYAFDDADNVPFWWERGAHTTWQLVATTIEALDRHDLWTSKFFAPFAPLRATVGGDVAAARALVHDLALSLPFGLLTEVHTYTYRSAEVMLSTAQDHRPGAFAEQYHGAQATLDEHAIVFTTHPRNEPHADSRWLDTDGYWTGTGSMPRSAQHRTVLVQIYAPQFTPSPPPLDRFTYLPYTHAYFPRERFDEVEARDGWTFGRRGDGYVGVWSRAPVRWRAHDPARVFTHGLTEPFDLVADGAENIWILCVGEAGEHGDFATFRAAIAAAPVWAGARAVRFTSPTEGAIAFGWDAPLTVNGVVMDLHPANRMENPFVTVPFGGRHYDIRAGHAGLLLDFDNWSRTVS